MTSGKFRTVSTVSSSLKLLTRAMAPPRPGGTPDNGGHNAVSVRTLPLLEEVGPLSSLLYIDKQTMFDNAAQYSERMRKSVPHIKGTINYT